MTKPPNFPPGPRWLPLVGNLPQLRHLSRRLGGQHLALSHLARQHNTTVLGLKLGGDLVVTVFSHLTVRQVLLSEEFEGRPDTFFLRLRCLGRRRGITCTDGPVWASQRGFVVRHLRSLGLGKRSMEAMVRAEAAAVARALEGGKEGVRVGQLVAPAVLNILWTLTTGSGIAKECELHELLDLLGQRARAFDMAGGTLSLYPWLRFLAPEWSGFNLIRRINGELRGLVMESVRQHYATWEEGRRDDLMHCFLSEMRQENGLADGFTDDQLIMVCLDLFIAGSQTTSSTLDFAFLAMIMQPEIQAKVQAQIDQVLERNSLLEYSDRHKLPYVEAVLLEVQRYRHVVPIGGPRRALRDTFLDGYFIPKDTTILISFHSVHNDKNYWKDPEVFRPERFLDVDGSLLPQERLMPFGLGKRRCLGEILAKNCIFFFFVEILRKYNVALLEGSKPPSGVPLPGITLSPEQYKVKFVPR